eukprot:TRINITY_DN32525_c0_g1_i2.p1 TRINITY_DN32525_c0_g1~~TRINITY_DN32525_c0_g1_i2.p1  ORF type:complete len:144 (-),score=12.17 TRINITY_DN32525_c0_g1_i2:330-761(-)
MKVVQGYGVSVRQRPSLNFKLPRQIKVQCSSEFPVRLTDSATAHVKKLKASKTDSELVFRIGIRQGGCSGMSYKLEFVSPHEVSSDDPIIENDGLQIACDNNYLNELMGVNIDYKDEIVGGGFKFSNPNATKSCGCGESFSTH